MDIILDGTNVGVEFENSPDCVVIYSYGVMIFDKYRNKGYGTRAHEARLLRWKKAGYSIATCIVRADNMPQMKIMHRFGWKIALRYTEDEVQYHYMVRDLSKPISESQIFGPITP